jgi:hypothetical protein
MDNFDGDDGYQDNDAPGTAAQQEDDLFEQELQAELAKGLGEESDDDEGDEDEEQEEESESEEEGDEEEDEEFVRTRKLLNEEIRDLEAAVAKKEQDIAGTQNILIKVGERIAHIPGYLISKTHIHRDALKMRSRSLRLILKPRLHRGLGCFRRRTRRKPQLPRRRRRRKTKRRRKTPMAWMGRNNRWSSTSVGSPLFLNR